jgi:hypothetical protein
MNKLVKTLLGAGLLTAQVSALHAAVTAEEAKQLGTTLTAIGAEKACNKDGTIPEYTGGLTKAPPGYDESTGVRPDPFANEKPLFSIDAKNMDKYADQLTEGTKALMKSHPDFRIDVYPTHRSAALPQPVLDNTMKNAPLMKLSADGLSIQGPRAGIPFPIPKNGNEAILNHIARYQGASNVLSRYRAYNVDRSGKLVLSTGGTYTWESPYYAAASGDDANVLTRARANYTMPARRSSESILTLEPVDYSQVGRRAWQYLPGQRRVRLAPDLAYDTPNPSTSGMSTIDDVGLYNGKMDRYDFTLVGKKEMYVPYNDYRFVYNAKPEDVFGPQFISPDAVRWELHRVWVVEAKLKEGQRHVYSRRTFYQDEDSWIALADDQYDGQGQLWRPSFAYMAPAYEVPAPMAWSTGGYDLIAGTYYINTWPGTGGVKVSPTTLTPDRAWTPDSLAAQGIR